MGCYSPGDFNGPEPEEDPQVDKIASEPPPRALGFSVLSTAEAGKGQAEDPIKKG